MDGVRSVESIMSVRGIIKSAQEKKCFYTKRDATGEWQCTKSWGHRGRHEPPLIKELIIRVPEKQ
jgi:hypothetical protein